MPLFMRVRGEGEHGIEELELKEEVNSSPSLV